MNLTLDQRRAVAAEALRRCKELRVAEEPIRARIDRLDFLNVYELLFLLAEEAAKETT